MTDRPPSPENPDIVALQNEITKLIGKIGVLEQSMKTQKAEFQIDVSDLEGKFKESNAATKTEIDNLKWLVRGVIIAFVVSVAAAFIGRLLGYI